MQRAGKFNFTFSVIESFPFLCCMIVIVISNELAHSFSLSQQPSCKTQERLHILEVRHQPRGDSHRASGLAIEAKTEVVKSYALLMTWTIEAHIQFNARESERDLARAGVAETSGA